MDMRGIVTVLGLSAALNISTGHAAKMSGREIMEKQKAAQSVKTEFEVQKMILVDKSGKKEVRELKRYTKEFEKDVYRNLIVFLAPADVKGTALLIWQHKNRADDQWLFLPAAKKLQRIAKGSKKNYFMGTDFTFEDMEGESIASNQYKLVREEKVDGKDCYVVEAVPASKKKARASGYKRRLLWVRKDIFATVKTEFYSKRGKLLKTQHNKSWAKVSGTVWRPKQGLMDNQKVKHKTLVGSVERKVNSSIPNSVFTERYILKGKHTQD